MLSIYEIATGSRSKYLIKVLGREKAHHLSEQSLHELLTTHRDSQEKILVLLDEKHFVMAHSHQHKETKNTFTAEELHQTCLAVSRDFRDQYAIAGHQLYYYVHNIRINGEASEYVIGSSGDLSRDITCIYLKNDIVPLVEQHRDHITIIPQSLATIHHIQSKLDKTSFSTLWIHDDYAKIISIENDRYTRSRTIHRGKKKLMEMITDNGVGDYFLHYKEKNNPIAEKLLKEAFGFYCQMIVEQLDEVESDMIVISDLIHHSLFMEVLQEHYHQEKQGYLVPLHISEQDDKYLTVSDMIFALQYADYFQKHLISVA